MSDVQKLSNVILLTRGTKGDLYPFLSLGQGFRDRGCSVTLLSNYCYESYALKESFEFYPLDDEHSYQIFNNMPEYYKNLPSLLELYREHTVATLEREIGIIERIVAKGSATIVANSNHYLASIFAKEKFDVPLHLCLLAPSYVHSFALFEGFLISLSAELNQVRVKLGLNVVQDWGQWLKSYNYCYAFWPNWFSDDATKVIPRIKYVGFLPIDKIEEDPLQKIVRDFIDSQHRNVLITHGTSKPFNDEYFKIGIEVCGELGHKLIVSTPFRELLPEILPEHVIWVDFCPFHELLPLIDLIIHHGGIGTIRESISNNKPQLIIGQGFDRQHNGKIIKNLMLGDWIAPKLLNFDTLAHKLNDLLGNMQIKARCEGAKKLLLEPLELDDFYEKIVLFTNTSHKLISAREHIEIEPLCHPHELFENSDNIEGKISSAKSTDSSCSDIDGSRIKQELFYKLLKNKRIEKSK